MVIKRKKNGPFTVTINTRTGKQTTSTTQKTGSTRLTHSTSNDGSSRRTTTIGFGDGWFSRATQNLNKKSGKRTSSRSSSSRKEKSFNWDSPNLKNYVPAETPKEFYEQKSFSEFSRSEWITWIFLLLLTIGGVIKVIQFFWPEFFQRT